MKRVSSLIAIVLLMLCTNPCANAGVRAGLDRDHIELGDSITLTLESDGSPGKPDLSALRKDFDVRGISTGSQTTIVNGSMKSTTQWTVTLAPKRAGVIDIPALMVGGEKTSPLRVGVDAASAGVDSQTAGQSAAHSPKGGGPIIIESSIAPEHPYVGQAVVYTLRLYYAVTLLDASLNVPTSDNGDLRQIGDDGRNSVMLQGHRYDVLERYYLLQPEHSGALHIPAPVFVGRTIPSFNSAFDDSLASGDLRTVGQAVDAQIRARPAQARDPWLPAKSVQLSIDPAPSTTRAGEPFSIVVRLTGEGVTAAQLPEITLPAIPGAQVYPEPSSMVDHARGGSLQAERTRRFAIVVDHAGPLRIPDLTVPWWDVVNDRAELARLSLPALDILPGSSASTEKGNAPPSTTTSPSAGTAPAATGTDSVRSWQLATGVLALLLVISLAWGWRRGRINDFNAPSDETDAEGNSSHEATLTRALALGDPAVIARALCRAAPGPQPRSLHELAQCLDDNDQRTAVLAFEAARWSAADGLPSALALAHLRSAFARPPRWLGPTRTATVSGALAPLYPTASPTQSSS